MPRTTEELVEEIVEVDENFVLTPFIGMANMLVTEVCEPVETYDEDRLEMIERLLAAHFYCILDPRAVSEGAGEVQVRYENQVGLGLDLTRYGQQAKLMDTAGGLAALDANMKNPVKGKPVKVSLSWAGKDYVDEGSALIYPE